MKTRKTIALVLALLLAVSLFAACGETSTDPTQAPATTQPAATQAPATQTPAAQTSDTRTIIDLQGNEVEIPYEVNKISTGKLNLTQLTLILAGSDAVANLGEGADASKGTLLNDMYPELEDMTVLTEDNMDAESILVIDPDLVMLYIRSAELGGRLETAGYSVALCGLSNEEELLETMHIMADALQGDALTQAEKYENYYRDLMADVAAKSASLAESAKPQIAYLRNDGTVCGVNSMPNNWITAAGGINIGALAGFDAYSAEMSAEELVGYDPDIIFCEGPGTLDFLSADQYQNLSAVKRGKLYVVPFGLSCSGLANAENPLVWQWAANIINPGIYNYDATQTIRDFFKDFYGYTLSDDQLLKVLYPAESLPPASPDTPATRIVTDMAGKEVEIPYVVNTYVESWFAHNAVDVMLDNAEGMLVTCAAPASYAWMYQVCPNMNDATYMAFSTDMSLEEIIAADPDVVFGSNENYREMFENVGIPFVNCMFSTYEMMEQSIALTAEVLGADAQEIADRYFDYLDEKIDWVASITDTIPEDERPYIAHGSDLYAFGIDGVNTIIDEWIKLAGGLNAASKDIEGNLQTVTMEQLLEWDPDILITGSDYSNVESILSDPAWQALSAVKNGRVYANPKGIFAWDRYGVEEALQFQYAAQLLYPELFEDFDLLSEVQYFYKEFLNYDLSADDAQRIINHQEPGETVREAAEAAAA